MDDLEKLLENAGLTEAKLTSIKARSAAEELLNSLSTQYNFEFERDGRSILVYTKADQFAGAFDDFDTMLHSMGGGL